MVWGWQGVGFNDLFNDDKHVQEQDHTFGLYLSQVITVHGHMAGKAHTV